MDSETQLIEIYISVCDMWEQGVWISAQRFSNHKIQVLTDQEIMTMYIFGCLQGLSDTKKIYQFCDGFLRQFFPDLKGYDAFCYRLRVLAETFISLSEKIIKSTDKTFQKEARKLMDSMPIVMAGAKRSSKARVASDLADKGYCAAKNMWFYGVKLQVIGFDRDNSIPVPTMVGLAPASYHDLSVFRQVSSSIDGGDLFGDSAYGDQELFKKLKTNQSVTLTTPIKLKRGQKLLDAADRLYSTAVSRIRQPIESFFNWLQEKTGIQKASKVRSTRGLLVHTFGRLCAGLFQMMFAF